MNFPVPRIEIFSRCSTVREGLWTVWPSMATCPPDTSARASARERPAKNAVTQSSRREEMEPVISVKRRSPPLQLLG